MDDEQNNPNPKQKGTGLKWGIGISIFFAVVFVAAGFISAFWGWQMPRTGTEHLTDLGNLGSFLQGTTASFWALAGVVLFFVAFLIQRQQSQYQQEALAEQKRQFEAEHTAQEKRIARERQNRINGVLQAIRYELEIVGQLYQNQTGSALEKVPAGNPYMCYFSLTEKYFIVYPQNTEIVGQIDAPELCKAIVNTYNKANFLIDAFRINNWYLDRGSEHERRQSDQYSQKILESTKENLIKHAANLKLIHQDLKSETGNLFARIAKYLAEHPAQ